MTKESLKVYDKLLQEIITLRFKPGDKISENYIALTYNMSRTPAREIIRKLEMNHLVEVKSCSGCYVTKIDLSSLHDIIFLRAACEFKMMASLFGKVSDEEITSLLELVEKQKAALDDYRRDGDEKIADKFFKLDNQMHKKLYALAGGSSILHYLNHEFPNYQRYRYMTGLRDQKDNINLYQTHKDLILSIKLQDIQFLDKTVNTHNYSCLDGIEKLMKKFPDYFIK